MLSPTEQFGDFLSQLPTGLFATVCGAALLLFMAFTWFAYFKPLRAKRLAGLDQANQPEALITDMSTIAAVETPRSTSVPDTGDLPDLDALIDTSTLRKELPGVPLTEDQPRPAPPAPVRSKDTYRVKLNTGAVIEAKEIVAIMRDPRDGRLVVQMNGTAYRTLIDAPEAKQDFVKVMKELSTVVTEPDDNPPPVEEASQPAAQSTTLPPKDTAGAMPGDLPSYKLEDSLIPPQKGGLFTKAKYEPAPIPELNIAAAIEAYLQHKLRHTPEYSGREIHVHSAPGGGVRIQVDSAYYEAVSDVEDTEIRSFLSATIQEWQDRQ